MHDDQDDLTPGQRDALRALPAETRPPAHLEERVVAALRASGRLATASSDRGSGGRRRGTAEAWLRRAAAAIVLVLAGAAMGRLTAPPAIGSPTGAAATSDYLLLLYGGESATPAEEADRVAEYGAWAGRQAEANRLVSAEKLQAAAIVLGPSPGAGAVSSEPSGFFVIRAESVDAAVAIARDCPHLRHGGTVVVRPIDVTR